MNCGYKQLHVLLYMLACCVQNLYVLYVCTMCVFYVLYVCTMCVCVCLCLCVYTHVRKLCLGLLVAKTPLGVGGGSSPGKRLLVTRAVLEVQML